MYLSPMCPLCKPSISHSSLHHPTLPPVLYSYHTIQEVLRCYDKLLIIRPYLILFSLANNICIFGIISSQSYYLTSLVLVIVVDHNNCRIIAPLHNVKGGEVVSIKPWRNRNLVPTCRGAFFTAYDRGDPVAETSLVKTGWCMEE